MIAMQLKVAYELNKIQNHFTFLNARPVEGATIRSERYARTQRLVTAEDLPTVYSANIAVVAVTRAPGVGTSRSSAGRAAADLAGSQLV